MTKKEKVFAKNKNVLEHIHKSHGMFFQFILRPGM